MGRQLQRLLWAVCFSLLAVAAMAQSGSTPVSPAATVPTKDLKTDDKPLREQTIYVPYEKLQKVFEKEGRGVFLPYEKFRELWDAAQRAAVRPIEVKPPVGAAITQIESEAVVAKEVVRVTAVLKIDVLGKGWHEAPLRLADAAITAARLGDQPARIISDGPKGYKLLIERTDDQPGQVDLALEYVKAITRAPGQNSVSFEAPQAPVNRWLVRVPEPGVKVELSPLVAATELTEGRKPDETAVLAFVGAAPSVRIAWTPKAEGAAGLEAVASVQAEQQVTVDEGVTRSRVQLAYTISRAELPQLTIEVPADYKVVNVFDANVRQWSVEPQKEVQRINVQLFEPAKGSQSVTVELERFAQDEQAKGEWTVDAPVVRAADVGRQQGVVVAEMAEGLRGEVAASAGLVQMDAAELPPSLARGKWAFAYRYPALPFKLQLAMEKIEPRILADALVKVDVQPERLTTEAMVSYTIERAGVFRLELDVPTGYTVEQVQGRAADGASVAQVDTYHLEGQDKGRLVVNLARKALGRVGLAVRLRRNLDQPELLRPLGKPAEIPLPIPQVVAEGIEQATGRLVIYAPESLRINPTRSEGLRAISFREARLDQQSGQAPSGSRPVLTYAFGRDPIGLNLAAERRMPQVTVRQLLTVRADEGVVRYEAALFYDILYSGVSSIAVDVPADVAAVLRNRTASIRERTADPPPPDLAPGCVRWILAGESELAGSGRIDLGWEKKIDKLDVGSSVSIVVPRLLPVAVDRSWGQVVLVKAETMDIQPSPEGLRPIDPQHDLMPGASVPGAAAAFEFHDDWKLAVAVTRYKLEEVKQTSIERAVLRMVLTRSRKIATQALYRMRSAGQRLVVAMPPGAAFDGEPRLNGRRVTLEVGQQSQFYIPLVGMKRDEPFLLEFRYTLDRKGNRLDYPVFPLEPAVQEVFLCVYLPDDVELIDASGPWTKRFGWGLGRGVHFWPINDPNDQRLLEWVSEGSPPAESFPTDGRLYVFSALQPGAPADAALRVVQIDSDWLHGAALFVVVLAGLVLLPVRASYRMLGIGLLVIAMVVVSVFQPLLIWQIVEGTLLSAVVVVLVVWTMKYFVWTLPRQPRVIVATAMAGPPPTKAEPPAPPSEAAQPPLGESRVPDGQSSSSQGGQGDA